MKALNGFGLAFLLATIVLILSLPRRWAALALLLGTFSMTLTQGLQIGPFNFFAIRLLLLAGIVRVVLRRERIAGDLNGLDKLMIAFAVWATLVSLLRDDPLTAFKANLGIVFNTCGSYFLLRVFCTSIEDSLRLCAMTVLLLAPLAVEMFSEHITLRNAFAVLGGAPEWPQIREGHVRAQGPFGHPILAGTVGAVCLPLAIALWKSRRAVALAGVLACVAMILGSASSGPVMSGMFGLVALLMWPLRDRMRHVRRLSLLGLLALSLVMKAPPYYLIARIDIAGGSTGWYRARLIESSLQHIDEWWLAGTDRTGHWMATGLDADHADITNHYIFMGVTGGIVLLVLFVFTLAAAFRYVGAAATMAPSPGEPDRRFFVWSLGAALFAHAATFISVSYFDQSFVSLYLTLAAIAAVGIRETATKPNTAWPARPVRPWLVDSIHSAPRPAQRTWHVR